MPTGHIHMAMTLDGFVARPDHALDWLLKQPVSADGLGFQEFMDSIDVLLMGSGSLKTVLGFDEWPYQKPVIVLSRSMSDADIPEHLHGKIEFSQATPEALWIELGDRGYDRIYVDGGAIIRSFLKAGFVHELNIGIVPILIGQGVRIFGGLDQDIDLDLISTKADPSGLVMVSYRRKDA